MSQLKALFTLFVLMAHLAGAEVLWQTKLLPYTERAESKPSLIYFTADWCGPCKLMKQTTLKDPLLNPMWEKINPIMLDYDRNIELVQKYQVRGIPALILLNRYDEVVTEHSGYMTVTRMLQWWNKHKTSALSELNHQEQEQERFLEVAKSLEMGGDAYEKAKGELLNLLIKDSNHEHANRVLSQYWRKNPKVLLKDLNAKRLFERLVANKALVSYGIGYYDPWADAKMREQSLNLISKKLESK